MLRNRLKNLNEHKSANEPFLRYFIFFFLIFLFLFINLTLNPPDYHIRLEFCSWILRKQARNVNLMNLHKHGRR